jgi:hypothetical protein
MICSQSITKLAEALSKAQGTMKHAVKDADNPFFRSKYADLQSVVEATRPSLVENGLSVVQITEGNVLWTMLLHTSGEWIKGSIELKPMRQVKDTGWVESHDPQSYGSCITYARRYAMAAITGCATEDDDGNAASGNKVPHKAPATAPQDAPQTTQPLTGTIGTAQIPLVPPPITGEKKDMHTLTNELKQLAEIAVDAGKYPNEGDAVFSWTSYRDKKTGQVKGFKAVSSLKHEWQVEGAMVRANDDLNSLPPGAPDADPGDDLPV